jgi:hypothetical protein
MKKSARESMKLIGMIAASCLALAMTPATSRSADVPGTGPAFVEIAPPPEEVNEIRLSGKSENPTPEAWLRMREKEAPPWWLGPTGRIVVRNVSQATSGGGGQLNEDDSIPKILRPDKINPLYLCRSAPEG